LSHTQVSLSVMRLVPLPRIELGASSFARSRGILTQRQWPPCEESNLVQPRS